jgi:hypothetical protein
MLKAVYDETDPLYKSNWYGECSNARIDVDDGMRSGREVVYVYYDRKKDQTTMTTVEGDFTGIAGSSAGFKGKVELRIITPEDMAAIMALE